MKNKKLKVILAVLILLGLFIFFFIGWAFYQEPRQSQERERERIKEIAEENPEAAEKLKLWREGKIELSQEEIEELVNVFDGELSDEPVNKSDQE